MIFKGRGESVKSEGQYDILTFLQIYGTHAYIFVLNKIRFKRLIKVSFRVNWFGPLDIGRKTTSLVYIFTGIEKYP